MARNPFPPQYAQIHERHQPAELYPQYTAVEYLLPQPVQFPLAVLLVVDLCVEGEDLQASTMQTLNPEHTKPCRVRPAAAGAVSARSAAGRGPVRGGRGSAGKHHANPKL